MRGDLIVAAACALLSSGVGFAQTIDENLWVTNGPVYSVVRDGGTIYIGGAFTRVGPVTGGGVPLDGASGALPPSFPKVNGAVYAVILAAIVLRLPDGVVPGLRAAVRRRLAPA